MANERIIGIYLKGENSTTAVFENGKSAMLPIKYPGKVSFLTDEPESETERFVTDYAGALGYLKFAAQQHLGEITDVVAIAVPGAYCSIRNIHYIQKAAKMVGFESARVCSDAAFAAFPFCKQQDEEMVTIVSAADGISVASVGISEGVVEVLYSEGITKEEGIASVPAAISRALEQRYMPDAKTTFLLIDETDSAELLHEVAKIADGQPIVTRHDTDYVAFGAAMQSDVLAGNGTGILLAMLSYEVWVDIDGTLKLLSARRERTDCFRPDTIPIDCQLSVEGKPKSVNIFEWNRKPNGKKIPLGRIEMNGFDEIDMAIDAGGNASLTVSDTYTGAKKTFSLPC